MWTILIASVAIAACPDAAFAELDCDAIPCGDVLPKAVRFQPVDGALYWEGLDAQGERVGWVALSTDLVDVKAYSGKPLVTLVGLDPKAVITGAKVIHHSEPILLVGIPERLLHEFAAFYRGLPALQRVIIGRADRPDAVAVDAISGATVTSLAQNMTILETARRLGAQTGVIEEAAIARGHFVASDPPWTFDELLKRGALGHLEVSQSEMGAPAADAPYIDLYFGIADAPQVGRALLGDRDYDYYMGALAEGEHLLVVLNRGTGSFKGSAFVRGGIFDRVRLEQGLREITFRDVDYYNLSGTAAKGAPDFREGALFVLRAGRYTPAEPFDFIFLGSRYNKKGAFSRDYREFARTQSLPSSVYVVDRAAGDMPWRDAWRLRVPEIAALSIYLLFVMGVFVARRYTTADPSRIKRLHVASMVFGFLGVGVWMRAQPSVTQILTFLDGMIHDLRWSLFLSEPTIFLSWIFIAIVSVWWGRGVFCGWVCPYGAMTELGFKLGRRLGLPERELPDWIHLRLRMLRYAVLGILVAVFLWDSVLGEKLAEVEPFKSTFLVPFWSRSWGFGAWWIALFGVSLLAYRPFCRYLCPLGAGLALMSSFRPSGPRRRVFCNSCKICTRGCEPRAFRPDGSIDPRECLSCMDCEATYRNDGVCPPLLGIARLQSAGELSPHDRAKLARLREEAADL